MCQAELILTLNCVTVSKWVLDLIWYASHNLSENCFLYTLRRANEKTAKIRWFTPISPCYNIFIDVLFIIFKDID